MFLERPRIAAAFLRISAWLRLRNATTMSGRAKDLRRQENADRIADLHGHEQQEDGAQASKQRMILMKEKPEIERAGHQGEYRECTDPQHEARG